MVAAEVRMLRGMLSALVIAVLVATPVHDDIAEFFGQSDLETIQSADHVEIYRIEGRADGGTDIDGFGLVARGPTLRGSELEELANFVVDGDTYERGPACEKGPGGCGYTRLCGPFRPSIALRFWRTATHSKSQSTDVLICLGCGAVGLSRRMNTVTAGQKRRVKDYSTKYLSVDGELRATRRALDWFPRDADFQRSLIRRRPDELAADLARIDLPANLAIDGGSDADAVGVLRAVGRFVEVDGVADLEAETLDAAESLGHRQVLRLLEQHPTDRILLFGASKVLLHRTTLEAMTTSERERWLPYLAGVALTTGGPRLRARALKQLAAETSEPSRSLLRSVARDAVPFDQPDDPQEPTMRAQALLALVGVNDSQIRPLLEAFKPTTEIDRQAVELSRVLLGGPQRLTVPLIHSKSSLLRHLALDIAVRTADQRTLDVLIEDCTTAKYLDTDVRGVVEYLLREAWPEASDVKHRDFPKAAAKWWAAHRLTYKPALDAGP